MSTRQKGILSGLIASAIWGGMYVVSKVILGVIPPFALLSLRLLSGALALGLWTLFTGKSLGGLKRSQWMHVLAVGLLGYGISLGLQFTGTKLSTAANGAVVTAATPAFVYLFAWLLLKEQISARRLVALAVSTLGVLAVIDPRQAQLGGTLWLGNLFLVAAAITWALYSVLVRQNTQRVDTLSFSFVAFLGGMFLTIPVGAWEVSQQPVGEISLGIVAGILYLGIVSTAVAAYLWNRAFELLDAGVASLTFFAQPIVGAALGALFLGEKMTPLFITGAILILLGLWLAARDDRIDSSPRRKKK
jgi:drug/metabolite transporter (DMT)-like permease